MKEQLSLSKNGELFDIISENEIVLSVEKAFKNLNDGIFGDVSIDSVDFQSQAMCCMLHELIVFEISKKNGWRRGKQNKEPDLVHESGVSLQVKTNSNPDGIAGNRHSNKNLYCDPSEFYLCVNFIPNDCICKVRAGWINANAWKPQNGNGNAATLKKHVLQSLPILEGEYLKGANLITIEGIGEKSLLKLNNEGIFHLKDLVNIKNYIKAKKILSNKSIGFIDEILLNVF